VERYSRAVLGVSEMAWPDLIKSAIRAVVQGPGADALALIDSTVAAQVPATALADVRALIVDELRRLREGVLALYGSRPSEFVAWKRRDHES
jgi:hypothetical protein